MKTRTSAERNPSISTTVGCVIALLIALVFLFVGAFSTEAQDGGMKKKGPLDSAYTIQGKEIHRR